MSKAAPGIIRRSIREFTSRFGSLLLAFGALLLGIGGLMQLARLRHMDAFGESGGQPAFEASLGGMSGAVDAASLLLESPATPVVPLRVEIPSVGIDTGIEEVGWEARIVNGERKGNVWTTADYAAGLHQGSAGIGAIGNTVISGHNNVAGAVFSELHAVEAGDVVYLSTDDRRKAYAVDLKFVLWEEGATPERRRVNAEWIESTEDERITLVSCYPPWGNSHRVIVVARPIEGEEIPDLSGGAAAR